MCPYNQRIKKTTGQKWKKKQIEKTKQQKKIQWDRSRNGSGPTLQVFGKTWYFTLQIIRERSKTINHSIP